MWLGPPNHLSESPSTLSTFTTASGQMAFETTETTATTTTTTMELDDALLVSDGFLVPGKDHGGLYVVKNPSTPREKIGLSHPRQPLVLPLVGLGRPDRQWSSIDSDSSCQIEKPVPIQSKWLTGRHGTGHVGDAKASQPRRTRSAGGGRWYSI